jgi:hypothetical protein
MAATTTFLVEILLSTLVRIEINNLALKGELVDFRYSSPGPGGRRHAYSRTPVITPVHAVLSGFLGKSLKQASEWSAWLHRNACRYIWISRNLRKAHAVCLGF